MKKKNILKLVSVLFGTIVVAAMLLVSAVGPKNNTSLNAQKADAVVSYIDASPYVQKLIDENEQLPTEFSLAKIYPVYSENQTNSELCWIYSSMKVLETSVMVQKDEYHNFSEIGTAVLYYLNYKDTGTVSINSTGDFEKFNLATQEFGLIYENDFSNDLYFDINEENLENYENVAQLADTKFMQNIRPIALKNDVLFSSQELEVKTEILKRYIKEYGGVFAGLEPGTITKDGNSYINEVHKDSESDRYFEEPHAACIIGWNDNYGWIAVNSWGRASSDFNTFYIPFDYEHIYSAACGYVVLENNDTNFMAEDVFISNSNATRFAESVLAGGNSLKNLFCYKEDLSLTYQISNKFDFDEIYVNIFSGKENVTNQFKLNFEVKNHLTITSNADSIDNLGGGYEVRIYVSDELVSQDDFYIYTGVDLSYTDLVKDGTISQRDSVVLSNTMASNESSATYYVSSGGANDVVFKLYLYLPETTNTSKVTASIGSIYEVANDGTKSVNSSVRASVTSKFNVNYRHEITINSLTRNNAGKLIEFSVTLESTLGKTKEYSFKFFISSNEMVNSSSAYVINYELDGGKNSADNITKYPNYELETTKLSFKLNNPTKFASNFMGWFTDSEFKNEITEIDETFSGDIVLYAKWEVEDTNYMQVDFTVSSLKHYGESQEINYTDGMKIIYGDSVYLNFNYVPNTANLVSYNYYIKYHYYFGEKEISSDTLVSAASIYLPLEFPTLVRGTYSARLEVTMVISRSFSISIEEAIEFTVSPKEVTATFSNLNHTYDRNNHKPTVTLNGTYAEDGAISAVVEDVEHAGVYEYRDVGDYTFIVSSLGNQNYAIAPNQTAEMHISQASLVINWNTNSFTYNGLYQVPTCTKENTGEDLVDLTIKYYDDEDVEIINISDIKDVGTYKAVASVTSKNYKLTSNTEHTFKINPKNIKIKFNDVEQRFTVAPNNRTGISYTVEGLASADSVDSLGITYICEGLTAQESGSYPITGTYNNPNYNAEIISGTYKILGHYYVYYTLPDGTVYTEDVDDGYDPQGVPKDVYKVPLFGKIKYSEPLKYTGSDLYIKVSHTNYTWVVLVAVVVVAFLIIFYLSTRKARRNKNR